MANIILPGFSKYLVALDDDGTLDGITNDGKPLKADEKGFRLTNDEGKRVRISMAELTELAQAQQSSPVSAAVVEAGESEAEEESALDFVNETKANVSTAKARSGGNRKAELKAQFEARLAEASTEDERKAIVFEAFEAGITVRPPKAQKQASARSRIIQLKKELKEEGITEERKAEVTAEIVALGGKVKAPKQRDRKITLEDAKAIVSRIRAGERSHLIAKEYNLHQSTVSDIKAGRLYPEAGGRLLTPEEKAAEREARKKVKAPGKREQYAKLQEEYDAEGTTDERKEELKAAIEALGRKVRTKKQSTRAPRGTRTLAKAERAAERTAKQAEKAWAKVEAADKRITEANAAFEAARDAYNKAKGIAEQAAEKLTAARSKAPAEEAPVEEAAGF